MVNSKVASALLLIMKDVEKASNKYHAMGVCVAEVSYESDSG